MDLDREVFPEIGSGRLIEMLERLPLYDGALTARANEENERSGSGLRTLPPEGGREEIGSSGAELISHPAFAGLIEYKQV